HDPGVAVRDRILPATWRTARTRPISRDVLRGVLIHRGQLHRRVDVPPSSHSGRVAPRDAPHRQKGSITTYVLDVSRQPASLLPDPVRRPARRTGSCAFVPMRGLSPVNSLHRTS